MDARIAPRIRAAARAAHTNLAQQKFMSRYVTVGLHHNQTRYMRGMLNSVIATSPTDGGVGWGELKGGTGHEISDLSFNLESKAIRSSDKIYVQGIELNFMYQPTPSAPDGQVKIYIVKYKTMFNGSLDDGTFWSGKEGAKKVTSDNTLATSSECHRLLDVPNPNSPLDVKVLKTLVLHPRGTNLYNHLPNGAHTGDTTIKAGGQAVYQKCYIPLNQSMNFVEDMFDTNTAKVAAVAGSDSKTQVPEDWNLAIVAVGCDGQLPASLSRDVGHLTCTQRVLFKDL